MISSLHNLIRAIDRDEVEVLDFGVKRQLTELPSLPQERGVMWNPSGLDTWRIATRWPDQRSKYEKEVQRRLNLLDGITKAYCGCNQCEQSKLVRSRLQRVDLADKCTCTQETKLALHGHNVVCPEYDAELCVCQPGFMEQTVGKHHARCPMFISPHHDCVNEGCDPPVGDGHTFHQCTRSCAPI